MVIVRYPAATRVGVTIYYLIPPPARSEPACNSVAIGAGVSCPTFSKVLPSPAAPTSVQTTSAYYDRSQMAKLSAGATYQVNINVNSIRGSVILLIQKIESRRRVVSLSSSYEDRFPALLDRKRGG